MDLRQENSGWESAAQSETHSKKKVDRSELKKKNTSRQINSHNKPATNHNKPQQKHPKHPKWMISMDTQKSKTHYSTVTRMSPTHGSALKSTSTEHFPTHSRHNNCSDHPLNTASPGNGLAKVGRKYLSYPRFLLVCTPSPFNVHD